MDDFEKYLREADLEALEDSKAGRGPCPVIYKAGFVKPAEPGGPMVFVASDETVDRLGDIIGADGWQLDAYRKNPVFMWQHDHTMAPIGTVPKIWVEDKQLLNMVAWDEADELARFIKGKFERRVLRAESVGFRAIEFEDNGKSGGIRFTKQELLEISAVSIPAHPKALAKAMGARKFSIVVPELVIAPKEVVEPSEEVLTEKPISDDLQYESYFEPSGIRRYRAKVACPRCGLERWVDRRAVSKETFTGLCHSCNASKSGKNHPMYKDGIYHQSNGYVGVLVSKDDPFASMRDCRGYVYAHRYEMAKHLDRSLESYEHVHHLDGNKTNNQIDNLALVGEGEHLLITKLQARIRELEGSSEERPYAAEHSCRLKPPADFQPDSFKRTEREHEGKKYSVIMGRLKDETAMTEQAYRYPKDTWEPGEAESHCESHDGSFEAASEEEAKSMEIEKTGAVLSRSNKGKLSDAIRLLQEVLESAEKVDDEGKGVLKDACALVEQFGKELRGG